MYITSILYGRNIINIVQPHGAGNKRHIYCLFLSTNHNTKVPTFNRHLSRLWLINKLLHKL